MDAVITVLAALGPVIAAAIDAAQRGGDWKKAAREALDASLAAAMTGPRAASTVITASMSLASVQARQRQRRQVDAVGRGDGPRVTPAREDAESGHQESVE